MAEVEIDPALIRAIEKHLKFMERIAVAVEALAAAAAAPPKQQKAKAAPTEEKPKSKSEQKKDEATHHIFGVVQVWSAKKAPWYSFKVVGDGGNEVWLGTQHAPQIEEMKALKESGEFAKIGYIEQPSGQYINRYLRTIEHSGRVPEPQSEDGVGYDDIV